MTSTEFSLVAIFLLIELSRSGIPDCSDIMFTGSSCKCCDGNNCTTGNECSLCPKGHFLQYCPCTESKDGIFCNFDCNGNATSLCHPCRQGYHQPHMQTTRCLKCPPGYEAISKGATLCSACPRGSYKNTSMISCQPCPAGHESLKEASTSCNPCLEGTHKSTESLQFCETCAIGYYILSTEALYCLQCPEGFYCPCSKCGPVACPDEAHCPKGSSSPFYCSSLYRWVNDGCYVSTNLVGIIVAVILLTILLMSVIATRIYFKPKRCASTWTSLGEDSSSSEPVYSGL